MTCTVRQHNDMDTPFCPQCGERIETGPVAILRAMQRHANGQITAMKRAADTAAHFEPGEQNSWTRRLETYTAKSKALQAAIDALIEQASIRD